MRAHSALGVMALALVLLATGCNSTDDAPRTEPTPTVVPSTSTTVTTPTSMPTAEPTTPQEKAKADALAALERYFKVTNQVSANPNVPLNRLKTVAISGELSIITNNYRNWRAKGWHSTGDIELVTTQVENISLDNSAPKKGKVPTVTIVACVDVSNVDVLDQQGRSQIMPARPDAFTDRYLVANYSWKTNKRASWKVASTEAVKQGESCDD